MLFLTDLLSRCYLAGRLLLLLALLSACDSGGGDSGPALSGDELADIEPFIADAAYSQQLKPCVLAVAEDSSCLLSELPLLVEENSRPQVADIMSRVLVSHPWMGQRFQQLLATLPAEFLQLFSAVTTIVIDDDVRPSYYQVQSSTIFIDPAYLWLNNTEKATVGKEADYRSDFDEALDFQSLARYVEGFDYAWEYYSLNGAEERSLEDIRLLSARLLLHELAHANDFFPPEQTPYLDQDMTVAQAASSLRPQAISLRLQQQSPLASETMYGLAEVMYLGAPASPSQRALSPLQTGEAMEADVASDDYAYSSPAEDVAMLFEEAMMKYLFDIDRDIAYSNRPPADAVCDDLVVAWGMRGRIGESSVKARAQLVLDAIYPGQDFSLFFQNLSAPLLMRANESWCDNLALL